MSLHLGSLALERLTANDLGEQERMNALEHLQACEACRGALRVLKEDRTRFLTENPAERMLTRALTQRPPRRLPTRWRLAAGAFASAALVLLVVRPGEPVRLKGIGLAVHRQRGREVQALGTGERVA